MAARQFLELHVRRISPAEVRQEECVLIAILFGG